MILKDKSIWTFLYLSGKLDENAYLPNNLCNLFWGILKGLIICIICFPTTIVNLILKKDRSSNLANIASVATHTVLILFPYMEMVVGNVTYWVALGGVFKMLGTIIGFLLTIILLFVGIYYISGKAAPLREGVKSFKDKHCPFLIWGDASDDKIEL